MAATLDIACPYCSKAFKVPAELAGKVIRCKGCQQMFEVESGPPPARPAPARTAKARPVAAKPAPPADDAPIPFKEDPPPAPPPPRRPADDDDDDDNPYGLTADTLDVPRCPHCAKELDPPDTKVCLNCGYDLIGRKRHESKKVYETTPGEWALHLGPGIACIFAVIFLLALNIFVFMNMRDWLTGSILDAQEKNKITGEAKFYLPPFCFNLWVGVISAWLMWVSGKFAVKRLVYNWKPEERKKAT